MEPLTYQTCWVEEKPNGNERVFCESEGWGARGKELKIKSRIKTTRHKVWFWTGFQSGQNEL